MHIATQFIVVSLDIRYYYIIYSSFRETESDDWKRVIESTLEDEKIENIYHYPIPWSTTPVIFHSPQKLHTFFFPPMAARFAKLGKLSK